jgi:hypothetical protein
MRVALAILVFLSLGFASPVGAQSQDETAVDWVEAAGATIIIQGDEAAVPGIVTIDAEEAEETAGVQGDALKAITTVGSVARSVGGGTGVSVWGAAPADTRIYIDDVPVPRLFHIGGSRSILPSSEVDSFTLISGGAPARYGRGIGGAVVVESAEPTWRDMDMRIRLDPIDVGGGFGARLGESGMVSFAARSSVIAPVFAAVAPERADEAIAIPDYTDVQARASYSLSDGQELRVFGILSVDNLARGIPRRIESESLREVASAGFARLGLSIKRTHTNRVRKLALWVGRDVERTTQSFTGATAEESSRTNAIGALLVTDAKLTSDLSLRIGVDSEFSQSRWAREGAVSLPGREGDRLIFGQSPGNRVNRDDWLVSRASVGLFATASWDIAKRLTFEPGLRIEPSLVNGDRVLPVRPSEPRVGYSELYWDVGPRGRLSYEVFRDVVGVYVAGGSYAQAPSSGDLSPVFGSPILSPAKAWQLLTGVTIAPARSVRLGVEGFVSRQSRLAVRAASPTPAIASLLESTGEGRAIGLQLSLRADFGVGLQGNANYTFMEADRRQPGQEWRAFDLEQSHTLRAGLRWKLPSRLAVALRAEVTSGFPRTPVVGAIFNVASQEYDPVLGYHNGSRLPVFAEVSVRASYERDFAEGSIRLWLDVVNASNRSNALESYYSADYSRLSYIRGFPLLPLVGAELRI